VAKEKNPHLVALGAQIRTLRAASGSSQEDFAVRVGLDRSYYGGVERGERNISALNLVSIALALDVEVGELFPTREQLKSILEGEPDSAS
jgi:transcriptional regulator with XRE-family HTH domain